MAKKHWIYIKRGLSEDPKHRAAMGECVWLYMHIIDRADWEAGIALDWRDAEEAAGMGMPVDTLRRQRQKLEDGRYIQTEQKQHSQNIYIMEWRNPREYDGPVRNRRNESLHASRPSSDQEVPEGDNQGLNQVQAQVQTPTSNSISKPLDKEQEPESEGFKLLQSAASHIWPMDPIPWRKMAKALHGLTIEQDDHSLTVHGLNGSQAAFYQDRYARTFEHAIEAMVGHAVQVVFEP